MCMTDITKNNLYISKIINIVKSNNNNHNRLLHIKRRHSDAFVYILSGSCTYTIDNSYKFTANEGDILYLAHQSDYTMYIHTLNYRFIFCDFEFNETSPRKSDKYSPKNTSYAENLFIKLLHTKNSFADTISVLYNIYATVTMTANNVYIEKFSENKIAEAKNHIDTNYKDTSLSVYSLAEKTAMSEVYFRKLFKSQYHLSPVQYITSIRLKKAKELMKYPFLTLEECALQSGFSSLQYFCRVFKKVTGTTPAQYRKEQYGV